MNTDSKLQAVPRDAGNLVKDSPALAARRATASREAAVLDDLTSTRQYMNTLAMPAAQYMSKTIQTPEDAHPLGVQAAKDILDRTIGKAAQELRIGPADQTLDVLRELDET